MPGHVCKRLTDVAAGKKRCKPQRMAPSSCFFPVNPMGLPALWVRNLLKRGTAVRGALQRRRNTAPMQENSTNIAALTTTTQAPAGMRSK